ncbi:hypothetical protein DXA64_03515 [Collinsella sp. OF03-4AA]|nr:hypothetical protein DXA64_03515 [Collinsella sp. OF03-4AA]
MGPARAKARDHARPASGAFGVIGVVVYLILQFSLFTALSLTAGAFLALLCSLVFSRSLSGLAVECWPAARADGMAAGLSPAKKRAAIVVPLCAFAAASAAGMVACAQAVGALWLWRGFWRSRGTAMLPCPASAG